MRQEKGLTWAPKMLQVKKMQQIKTMPRINKIWITFDELSHMLYTFKFYHIDWTCIVKYSNTIYICPKLCELTVL